MACADVVDILPDMLDRYFPLGARFMIVMLADPSGGAATLQSCSRYVEESGLAGDDRVVFALDPNGNARKFYEGFAQTSVSVLTDRTSRIVLHEQFDRPEPLYFHIFLELQRYFEAIATAE